MRTGGGRRPQPVRPPARSAVRSPVRPAGLAAGRPAAADPADSGPAAGGWRRRLRLRSALGARLPLLVLGLAVLTALFFRLGEVPLFDVDEGAFSEATREMLARGDYVSTWLNGQPRFDKPILTYWLQAASVTLFGAGEFAFRLPSALAACAWIAATGVFAGTRFERRAGYAAAFIAATSAGVVVIGRGAIADALLNLWLALAMFDIMRYAADAPAPAARRYCRRAFLWIGLGLLTKGPVALLVPAAASLLGFALQRRIPLWWRAVRDPVGWLLLLAVAAPWYLLEYARRGDAFLDGFFMRHNVERFLEPLQGHGGGMLYYVPALLLVLLPYSGLFLRVLPGLRRRQALREPGAPDAFLWSWFLFVFVFFSCAGTKLPHYLLYGVTPLFILMARVRHAPGPRWLAFGPPMLLLAAVAALPWMLGYAVPQIKNAYVREALGRPEVFGAAWHLGAALLLGAGLGLAVWRHAPPWPRLACCGLLCAVALGGLLLPAVGELQQGPVKEAALLARTNGWAVHGWRINVPSFSVYRAAPTPATPMPQPGQIVLTRSDALDELAHLTGQRGQNGPNGHNGQGAHILYRKGGILLLRMPE